LNNVPGIGDKTMAKLRPELTVTGGTAAPASPAPTTPSSSAASGKKK